MYEFSPGYASHHEVQGDCEASITGSDGPGRQPTRMGMLIRWSAMRGEIHTWQKSGTPAHFNGA